jgi:hypothetical protein
MRVELAKAYVGAAAVAAATAVCSKITWQRTHTAMQAMLKNTKAAQYTAEIRRNRNQSHKHDCRRHSVPPR